MLLGAHCSGGVKGALDRAVDIGADAVQLFTQSPRTWRTPTPDPDAYAAFRERRAKTGIGAGRDAGLHRVEAAMRMVLDRCSDTTWLLMENSAGAGGTIGRSIDELAILYDRLDRHPRLGICLDSCHLYVSGYDVTDPGALDAALDEVDARIGLDRLRAVHVNDAK